MNFCPNCGAKIIDPTNQFCSNCGEKLPVMDVPAQAQDGGQPAAAQRPKPAPAPAAGRPRTGDLFGGAGQPPTPTQPEAAAFTPVFKADGSEEQATSLFSPATGEESAPAQNGASLFGGEAAPPAQQQGGAPAAPAQAPPAPPAEQNFFSGTPVSQEPASPPPEQNFFAGNTSATTNLFSSDTAPPPAPPRASGNVLGDSVPPKLSDTQEFFAVEESPAAPAAPVAGQDLFADAAPPPAEADPFAGAQPPAAFTAEEAESALRKPAGQPQQQQHAAPRQNTPQHPAHTPRQDAAPAATKADKKAAMVAQIAAAAQDAEPEIPAAAQGVQQPPAVPPPAPAPAPAGQPQQQMPAASLPGSSPEPTPAPVQRYPVQNGAMPGPSSAQRVTSLSGPIPDIRRGYRPVQEPPPPPRRAAPRRSAGSMVRTVLMIIFLFVLATFVVTCGLLYYQNRPALVIDEFAEALQQRDFATLQNTAGLRGVTATGQEGWEALCDAFADEANIDVLKSEMSNLSADPKKADMQYPSIRLKDEPLFLFIKSYTVQLTGVEVLVPGGDQSTVLRLNGVDHTGTAETDGMLVMGVMPGLYTAQVNGGAELSLSAFSLITPTRAESGEAPPPGSNSADITLENCISDNATLYVSGLEMTEKPVNGVVVLPAVPLGSEIRIVAEVEGAVQEAVVVFSDPAQTSLRFDGYAAAATVEPESESSSSEPEAEKTEALKIAEQASTDTGAINTTLSTYYTSYLKCINDQSMDSIQLSTDSNNQALAGRITSDGNKANIFTFTAAACDAASIKAEDLEGTPALTFNAKFDYTYIPREKKDGEEAKSENGSTSYSVQLVYLNGQWVVNSVG